MHQTKELEKFLISPLDNDDNTIAHLAAEGGNISVFKVSIVRAVECEEFICDIS